MSQNKSSSKFSRVFSVQPDYGKTSIITIETEISEGIFSFSLIGMTDKAVEEAKDRVSSALSVCHFPNPKHSNQKTIVSLAPADLRKNGSQFDLAISVGYLCASEIIPHPEPSLFFLGELSLDGEIQGVRGVLAALLKAEELGIKEIFIPAKNSHEVFNSQNVTVYAVSHIKEVVEHLNGTKKQLPFKGKENDDFSPYRKENPFKDIRGQEAAKRALLIAASGNHHIALYGPPGTGKTMLARAFKNLFPFLTLDETKEVSALYSLSGSLDKLINSAPFRHPHHSSSPASIIGGGSNPKPGEVTLAHRGVLFMDEFPEFDKRVLESLREPLEDKMISISRAKEKVIYPADFTLIVALNPCPCGFYGSEHKTCLCSFSDIHKYHKKLSGPLIDRIDLWTSVEHIPLSEFHEKIEEEADNQNNEGKIVYETRQFSKERNKKMFGKYVSNQYLESKHIPDIGITTEARLILEKSALKLKLSPRGYYKVIKVARTIADLEKSETIEVSHVLEALRYRPQIDLV